MTEAVTRTPQMSTHTPTRRIPVWLDCDPGHDDAFALILAGHSPALRLLGVSTVHGNHEVGKTTVNALNILHVSGLGHVPVVKGSERPLLRKARFCPEIHGESGLEAYDGYAFPPLPEDRLAHACAGVWIVRVYEQIMEHYREHGEKVTLIATGCLTNVALLLSVFPHVRDALHEIVIMGGAAGRGNTGSVAEFNIQVDPEAAAILFAAGIPLTMVPLDVTHTALVTKDVLMRVATGAKAATTSSIGTAAMPPGDGEGGMHADAQAVTATAYRGLLVALLRFFATTYRDVFLMPDPPLHDPCAVAYVINPGLFKTRRCRVDIETSNPLSIGQTIVDVLNIGGWKDDEKNVNVALEMDVPAFWKVMLEAIVAAESFSGLR